MDAGADLTTYRLTEAQTVKALVQLDRIGIIQLRPLNRYRLMLAKTFRWRPHGPVMAYFRNTPCWTIFRGFDADGKACCWCMAPSAGPPPRPSRNGCSGWHRILPSSTWPTRKIKPEDRAGFTLLLAARRWEFEALVALRR